ncbi:MAG: cysteine--tRNA ligase [Neisseriaceae bacterium]|nr:MAG: cysteine--tRNA ligase [Neisseriaceae bacterium]
MLKIYNTITKQKEEFQPINPKSVLMYVCGMTVYDYCHLGHARLMVVFDIIARWLKELGYPLTYVRNITDIDDKIIALAQKNNVPYEEITTKFINAMHKDSDALGVLRPDIEPRATEYIPEIIKMIETLINNHKAYVAENGDVYYSVKEFPAYGQLSGKNPDELRAGERVNINEAKKDPLDFALWKAVKPNEPYWPSPWGDGRPGWHIECSAMSASLFGEVFDIHGGGADLQFPHHENELAQNCGANHHFALETTKPKLIQSHVKYWIHNGFVRVDNEKMSKSLGNFFTIREILEKYPAEVVRFFLLRTHYRSPLNYSDAHLTDAKNALTRLYTTLKNTPPSLEFQDISYEDNHFTKRFFIAMNEDFNTTEAVAVLFELSSEVNKTQDSQLANYLKILGNKIGILTQKPTHFLQGDNLSSLSSKEIEHMIIQRNIARETKNWAESDRIRDSLLEHDIILEDAAEGTTWRKK